MRYVYVIRNLTNSKVYVGQTKDPKRRKSGHFYIAYKGNNRPLYRAIRKHGKENFSFEILEECEDDLINEREKYWVTHFDSFNQEKGYNLTPGGHQFFDITDKTKQKISNSLKGRNDLKRFGEKNPFFGRKHSLESLQKMSKSHQNFKHTPESKKKLSQALSGRTISLTHRINLSLTFKGKRPEQMLTNEAIEKRRCRISHDHIDAQPKTCVGCGTNFLPKRLTPSGIKAHQKKRFCTQKCCYTNAQRIQLHQL